MTNYRDEFNTQVKSGGIDGLIKALSEERRAGSEMMAESGVATTGPVDSPCRGAAGACRAR